MFYDCLVDDIDRSRWFLNYLEAHLDDEIQAKPDYVLGVDPCKASSALNKLAFGDIMDSTSIPRK